MPDVTQPIKDINALWKPFANKVRTLQSNMEKLGYPLKIIETIRRYERQKYLYSIGRRGIPGENPVTWTMKSNHFKGKAVDVCPKDGDFSDKKFYQVLAQESEKIGLNTLDEIGDYGHVEWTDKAQSKVTKNATKQSKK